MSGKWFPFKDPAAWEIQHWDITLRTLYHTLLRSHQFASQAPILIQSNCRHQAGSHHMKPKVIKHLAIVAVTAGSLVLGGQSVEARTSTATLDVRKAMPPPRFKVKAPDGAPNVLLVLLDDLGFAGTSAFGGPVATPTFDRLASGGLKYNNPTCSKCH
jgi:hypothetical protein